MTNPQHWPRRSLAVALMGSLFTLISLTNRGWAQSTGADYRQLGLSFRQQGQMDEAIAAFEQAVDLEPTNINGQVLLGWTQHLANQREAATVTLRTTVYQNPVAVPTLNALGIVYLVDSHLNDAVVVHTWAALLNPDNEIAYYNLSLSYHRLRQYDWAIAVAQRATELEPFNPHPFIALAIAHWDNDQPDQAQQVFQTALDIDGRYGDRTFLQYLAEAAFNPEQIAIATEILDSL